VGVDNTSWSSFRPHSESLLLCELLGRKKSDRQNTGFFFPLVYIALLRRCLLLLRINRVLLWLSFCFKLRGHSALHVRKSTPALKKKEKPDQKRASFLSFAFFFFYYVSLPRPRRGGGVRARRRGAAADSPPPLPTFPPRGPPRRPRGIPPLALPRLRVPLQGARHPGMLPAAQDQVPAVPLLRGRHARGAPPPRRAPRAAPRRAGGRLLVSLPRQRVRGRARFSERSPPAERRARGRRGGVARRGPQAPGAAVGVDDLL
jgi:hypothetical protein